jgi:hypothetical protein
MRRERAAAAPRERSPRRRRRRGRFAEFVAPLARSAAQFGPTRQWLRISRSGHGRCFWSNGSRGSECYRERSTNTAKLRCRRMTIGPGPWCWPAGTAGGCEPSRNGSVAPRSPISIAGSRATARCSSTLARIAGSRGSFAPDSSLHGVTRIRGGHRDRAFRLPARDAS